MPPTDAIILDNWVPRPGFCESRLGYIAHTSDLGGSVETLTAWKGDGNDVLIAGANGQLINITAGGAGVSLGSGYTNDRWQSGMVNDKLVLCNGADAELAFDGTSLTALDYTGSSPAITPGEFIGVMTWKGRAYYWKASGTSIWYAQAGAYQGELNEFDFGAVLQLGGDILTVFSWTVDSGTGPDDMMVIVFDSGELLLYQGDDPANADQFAQVGRFQIPAPLAVRGQMKYGSDVIIMTQTGYVNLTTVLREDTVSDYPAFSRKVSRIVRDVGMSYSAQYGHECIQTDDGLLIFNIPIGNERSVQLVRNTATGAWTRFTDIQAVTWEQFSQDVYFGSYDGFVYKQFGFSDNGAEIRLSGMPAYQYLDDPGGQKQLTAAQILSTHPDPKLISLQGYQDFTVPVLQNTTTAPGAGSGVLWDTSMWDAEQWSLSSGSTLPTTKGWRNIHAFGYAVTFAVMMSTKYQEIIWRQSGLRYRKAGAH
jgi:hypothetical protein